MSAVPTLLARGLDVSVAGRALCTGLDLDLRPGELLDACFEEKGNELLEEG